MGEGPAGFAEEDRSTTDRAGVCKFYRQGRCLKGGKDCADKHEGPQDLKKEWEVAHPVAAAETVKARANRKASRERQAGDAKAAKPKGKPPAAVPPPPAKASRRRRSRSAGK